MSTDQRLLYDASKAVIDGCCPAALAKRTIGPVSHARWLTTAVRILFLYMSTVNPTPEVIQMATFVGCFLESMKDRILSINGGIILGRPYRGKPAHQAKRDRVENVDLIMPPRLGVK